MVSLFFLSVNKKSKLWLPARFVFAVPELLSCCIIQNMSVSIFVVNRIGISTRIKKQEKLMITLYPMANQRSNRAVSKICDQSMRQIQFLVLTLALSIQSNSLTYDSNLHSQLNPPYRGASCISNNVADWQEY